MCPNFITILDLNLKKNGGTESVKEKQFEGCYFSQHLLNQYFLWGKKLQKIIIKSYICDVLKVVGSIEFMNTNNFAQK